MVPPSKRASRKPTSFRASLKRLSSSIYTPCKTKLQKILGFLLAEPKRTLALILLSFWVGILLSNFVLRGQFVFEGNVIAQEMSFIYRGSKDKLFLDNVGGIKNLDLQGRQLEPLVLTGKFSSTDSNLSPKLSKIQKITLQFPYGGSHFSIAPIQPNQDSKIAIQSLTIFPGSQVAQLNYKAQPAQLSLCLQSAKAPHDCTPDEHDMPEPVGNIQLILGEQPLNLTLNLVSIRELDIRANEGSSQDIFLQFIPENTEPTFDINSSTQLFIDLPTPKSNVQASESPQWIRGDINVEEVHFTRSDVRDDVRDEIIGSTILEGDVRMGKEVMKLQADQFLTVGSQPGISRLRYVQPHNKEPYGLRSLFSGKSTEISVGLYPELPVQSIKPSWLSKYLPQEGVNALLSFIGALTGFMLPQLLPKDKEGAKS
jgi:hypothetical protein